VYQFTINVPQVSYFNEFVLEQFSEFLANCFEAYHNIVLREKWQSLAQAHELFKASHIALYATQA